MGIPFDDIQTWEEFAATLPRDSTDTLRLMAAACYRVEVEQTDAVDVGEIVNHYFRRARWAHPVNLSATANYCASRGWLSEVGRSKNRKVWKITKHGYTTTKSRVSAT